jgi:hypothetical protein
VNSKKLIVPLVVFLAVTIGITLFPTMLRAFLPDQQTGTWVTGPAMSQSREAASSTVMYDGRVLIAGGKNQAGDPLATTEIIGVSGAIDSAAPMNIPRAGHAAVWLYDGYVLVTGGTTSGGGVTNTAEMYDPLADKWILLPGTMIDTRTGHTATNLPDGRILIAGGSNGSSALSSVETFSIVDEIFSFAGAMNVERQNHAAAALPDGRVLIVGGANADGAALASTSIFDPETNSIVAGPALNEARQGATATTLADGTVLIAGGRKVEGELSSLEIIDNQASSSRLLPVALATPRVEHSAILLKNNNQVLLVGGTSAGSVVTSSELYTPWTGELKSSAPTLAVHPAAVSANLAVPGRAFIAGGSTASTEIYGYATISTDAIEYIPGQTVILTGTGWQQGETVVLKFHRTDGAVPDRTFNVVASLTGNIVNQDFTLQPSDEFSNYVVTALGSVSTAQAQFADAVSLTSMSVQSTPAAALAGSSFQFGLRLTTTGTGNNTVTGNVTLSGQPAGVALTGATNFSIQGATSLNQNFTVSTTTAVAGGQYTLTFGNTINAITTPGTLTVNKSPAITTQPSSQIVSYPQNATFTVVASGYPAPTYQWEVSTDHGTSWAVEPGATSATYTVTSPQGLANGSMYRCAVSNTVGSVTSNAATLTVNKTSQTISFGSLPTKTYGDSPFTVSATSTSGLPVSFSVGSTDKCTIAGSTVTITGAGSCTVTATQSGDSNYSAAPNVPQTFTISKATATVVLSNLNQAYTGSALTPTATTNPSGLTVTWTGAPQTNVGSYTATATVSDANYQGSASGTFTVGKVDQTISFGSLAAETYGDAPFTVSATATSGLPVSFTTTGNCSNSGSSITLTGAGNCTVTASQSGNSNYNAATDVSQSFSIAKGAATIVLSELTQTYNGSALTPTAVTTPAGLSVTWTGAPQTGVGSYDVTATVNDDNYQGSASGKFTISKADQTITFGPLSDKTFGDSSFGLTATSTSGLPVSLTATGNCSISGAMASITGAGSCTVTANQAGDGNYNAANSVARSFSIAKAAATITLGDLTQTYSGSSLTPTATTTPAGLNVTWTGAPQTSAGTYSVTATINDPNYQGSAFGSFEISKATQTISFGALADKQYGDLPFVLTASASSGLSVTYSVGTSDSCTVAGSTVTIIGTGSCTITANQVGNSSYDAAAPVSHTFAIAKVAGSIALSNVNFVYDGSSKTVTATTSPAGLPVTITYNGSSAAPTAAGDYTVVATINDANHTGSVSGTLTIAKAEQTIEFAPLANQNLGVGQFAISARSSSGLPVTFTTSGSCSVSGSTITINDVGNCTVTAVQGGDSNYKTATPVLQTFAIVGGTPTLAWTAPASITFGAPLTGAQLNSVATYGGTGLTGTYLYSPAAGSVLGAGTHTLSVTFTPSDSAYNPVSSTVQISVAPAIVTVTAPSASRLYGDNNPIFTPQYAGFIGSDSTATPAACASVANLTSRVGTYAITCSGAGAPNYQFAYTPGALTVSPVTLTVTPTNVSRPQGQANPTLTGTITGIRNSDPITASYSTTATPASAVGTYPITATFIDGGTGALGNYTPVLNVGTLTVVNNKPDLVEAATMLTANPAAGTAIQVSDTVTNIGVSNANASMTRIYLSNNGTTKLASLGTHDVPPLASSASYGPVTTTVTLPTNYLGTYYIVVCADDVSSIVEANETNNCASSSAFTIQGADLVISSVSAPANAAAGSSISVVDTAKNQGAASANASVTRFYLSSNGTTKLTALGSRNVPPLTSLASSGPVTTAVSIPSNYVGTYYLIACADDVSSVVESNETNNCTASNSVAVQGADLVVKTLTVPSSGVSGNAFSIIDTTANTGTAPANASVTRFYLSNNGTSKVMTIGSRYVQYFEGVGSSGPVTTNVYLPDNIAGTYYLIACADDVASVQESNETNNCTTSSSFVIQGADLLAEVTGPIAATAGTVFSVTDRTFNQGQASAGPSTTRFYLSSNGVGKLTVLGGHSVISLPAGATAATTSTLLTMPAGSKGTYYIIGCTDDVYSVAESNETNNCSASAPFSVK